MFLTNLWAPGTVTEGESFLWYQATDRLQIGAALLWKQGSGRYLASWKISPETSQSPGLRVGYGVQGVGVGNPGYFASLDRSFTHEDWRAEAYFGIGFRSNEAHSHPLYGFKFSPNGPWTIGVQVDGHQAHPFLTLSGGKTSYGVYAIDGETLGLMFTVRD